MGAIKFNAEEILRMAEQIEINGAAFYRKAAENNEAGRELLLEMANQEDQHVDIFKDMKAHLPSSEQDNIVFDPNNEAALYLESMANANVFNTNANAPERSLDGSESLDDIIKRGILAEKDAVIFYTLLKEMVPSHKGKNKIDAIIKEELKHITWLINRKIV